MAERSDAVSDIGAGLEWVRRRLGEWFVDCPVALAAAMSEVNSCEQYSDYLSGVLDSSDDSVDVARAVLNWSIRRGEIWRLSSTHR
ncbi:hypothetical protein RMSM_01452 [Rhodopirellula maiorica SM1]|uniref:Uncharacterized protein n=1 Tax=Rhodopirellula maiorica SM1 TaxID=1265738 RepID=M5RQQ3_9BACT|nr:hypothetical protein RMSM_01452 [Rhodopirellula maiorica SM1]